MPASTVQCILHPDYVRPKEDTPINLPNQCRKHLDPQVHSSPKKPLYGTSLYITKTLLK